MSDMKPVFVLSKRDRRLQVLQERELCSSPKQHKARIMSFPNPIQGAVMILPSLSYPSRNLKWNLFGRMCQTTPSAKSRCTWSTDSSSSLPALDSKCSETRCMAELYLIRDIAATKNAGCAIWLRSADSKDIFAWSMSSLERSWTCETMLKMLDRTFHTLGSLLHGIWPRISQLMELKPVEMGTRRRVWRRYCRNGK
jgi:hypothetical protein